jgi:N-methylhydantoinase A/oxoprolinase/acetone carboxylase beta subunit
MYCVGIDTGGTYTDAALIDTLSGRVVASNKERTTPHDLSIGVG